MPCDSVTVIGIDAGKLDPPTLMRGLTADGHAPRQVGSIIQWTTKNGFGHQYDTQTGKLDIRATGYQAIDKDTETAAVKQSFGRQLLRDQAKKYGWQIKETGNKFQVTKRTL